MIFWKISSSINRPTIWQCKTVQWPATTSCHQLNRIHINLIYIRPLFTINFEAAQVTRVPLERFFDSLAPMFGHMVSLGQSNTLVLCPALTSHSELSAEALKEAGITGTTIRIAIGDESPRELIGDFLAAARAIDDQIPGFSKKFMGGPELDPMVDEVYADVHRRHAAAQPRFADCVK